MIGLALLMHLWMQPQTTIGPITCNYCESDPIPHIAEWELNRGDATEHRNILNVIGDCTLKEDQHIVDCRPKPAADGEHVIEIRTRHGMPQGASSCYITTTVPNSANDGTTQPCPVTRELWIDGVKFGVLKESEY